MLAPPPGRSPVVRLSVMMFLQFLVLGSTMPIISLYLKMKCGFSGLQTGYILAGSAVSTLVSPFIGALVADRYISAERLLSLTHTAGALVLFVLSTRTAFVPVFICYLFYWLLIGPTTALTTAITFHHAPHAVKTFGGIRLWGTIGWIVAAWIYRLICMWRQSGDTENLEQALQLGVVSSLVLALFMLFLPRGAPRNDRPVTLLPLRGSPAADTLPLHFRGIHLHCRQDVHVRRGTLSAVARLQGKRHSSGTQHRPGSRNHGDGASRHRHHPVLLLGALLEIIRFSLFMLQLRGVALYCAIGMHGLTYAFFFVTASIFLDGQCDRKNRSGTHQYFALFTGGVSTLAGNILSGCITELTVLPGSGEIRFTRFWLVPLLFSIAGFTGLALFFRPGVRETTADRQAS